MNRLGSLTVAAWVLTLLLGCNKARPDGSTTTDAAATPTLASVPGVLPPSDVVPGVSIYGLAAPFVDQNGAPAKVDAFRGHVTMIAMFYASCPLACPRLIANVKAIEGSLSPSERGDVRVMLVTIDPENDDPPALRAVVVRHALDGARWKLLTGKDDDIRDVAAVLGIKYRDADGSINHSSVITLLDREGHIDARYDGLADSRVPASRRVHELLSLERRRE